MIRKSLAAVAATAFAATTMLGAGAAAADPDAQITISPTTDRPAATGDPKLFTGDVRINPLVDPNEQTPTSVGNVHFAAGARTAWHTHPAGQTLIVTEGTGWVQKWGGPKQVMNTGDVVWIPAGVKHWHGATSTSAMTHTAITNAVDGSPVTWMEHVTDSQYLG
jgi:quercetin dioxygenase-like cupin family protein